MPARRASAGERNERAAPPIAIVPLSARKTPVRISPACSCPRRWRPSAHGLRRRARSASPIAARRPSRIACQSRTSSRFSVAAHGVAVPPVSTCVNCTSGFLERRNRSARRDASVEHRAARSDAGPAAPETIRSRASARDSEHQPREVAGAVRPTRRSLAGALAGLFLCGGEVAVILLRAVDRIGRRDIRIVERLQLLHALVGRVVVQAVGTVVTLSRGFFCRTSRATTRPAAPIAGELVTATPTRPSFL